MQESAISEHQWMPGAITDARGIGGSVGERQLDSVPSPCPKDRAQRGDATALHWGVDFKAQKYAAAISRGRGRALLRLLRSHASHREYRNHTAKGDRNNGRKNERCSQELRHARLSNRSYTLQNHVCSSLRYKPK